MTIENVNHLEMGVGVSIHPTAQIFGLEKLVIGDHCYIGPGVKIMGGGTVEIGDYSKLHDRVFIYGKKRVKLGHVAWIAQNTHLDGTDDLIAGNFLGVGHNSVLYTHMRHGDELQGYQMGRDNKLLIGEDVCFSGTCFVCPVTVEDRSIALVGSVVIKKMEYNRIYSGNPAIDVTDKLKITPYKEISLDEKEKMMRAHFETYRREINPGCELDRFEIVEHFPSKREADKVYYNIATRQYTKTNHPEEVALNKWLFTSKAKFIPI